MCYTKNSDCKLEMRGSEYNMTKVYPKKRRVFFVYGNWE